MTKNIPSTGQNEPLEKNGLTTFPLSVNCFDVESYCSDLNSPENKSI